MRARDLVRNLLPLLKSNPEVLISHDDCGEFPIIGVLHFDDDNTCFVCIEDPSPSDEDDDTEDGEECAAPVCAMPESVVVDEKIAQLV